VLGFIHEHRFSDLRPENKCSYEGKHEWKAENHPLLVPEGCGDRRLIVDHDERDSWELTREGHRALEEIIARFRSRGRNRWEIHKCFLWRTEFKKIIDPSYLPSSRDHKRPPRQRRRPYDATEQAIKLLEKIRMEYLPREKGGSTQDYGNRQGILWP
jgi:hypothetical protein